MKTPQNAASDLGLTICLCPQNGTLGLYVWVKVSIDL